MRQSPSPRIPIPTSPKRRLLLAIASCGLTAFIAAIASVSSISLLPPRIEPLDLDIAGAGARVVVDSPRALLADRLATDGDYRTLHKRAVLLGSLMVSEPVRAYIARHAGIDPNLLVGRAPVTANVDVALTDPDSERRANMIAEENALYRLEVHPNPTLPSLSLYAGAPTVREAERLADSAVSGLREYLRNRAVEEGKDPNKQVVLEQPARARGAIVNGGVKGEIFGLTFIFVFMLAAFALTLVRKLRREWTAPRAEPQGPGASIGHPAHPVTAVALALRAPSLPSPGSSAALKGGNWPRTTRVLPWMLAVMMAIVWLTPFNVIQLSISLPIDLKFDRLVLPFIIATWVLTIAAGAHGARRTWLTPIHIAIAGVAVAALLSLVIEARNLTHALELDTSVKKLVLLASYVSLFLIVASSIRRNEVPAFLKYTLGLALVCALGTVVEYRFAYNIFYSMSDALLPPIFTVGAAESGAVDQIGRQLVRGPGEVPLEAVAMLTMGLPIAIARLIQSRAIRNRILYGLVTAIILAAIASTERKSALLAPGAVLLTLAYFRRRELIRMAPLGVVIGVLMLALTPGAAQSVAAQLSGRSFNSVNTVSDRSSDYDAERPSVLSHLAFGRGYGSYEHTSYRILDMDLLRQLIEVGVFGLLAFIVMIATVVAVARRPIRERTPDDAAVALSAACAAVALLVVSTLFDAMAFPHCPYIALWMAGLLAVIVSQPREPQPQGGWSS